MCLDGFRAQGPRAQGLFGIHGMAAIEDTRCVGCLVVESAATPASVDKNKY